MARFTSVLFPEPVVPAMPSLNFVIFRLVALTTTDFPQLKLTRFGAIASARP